MEELKNAFNELKNVVAEMEDDFTKFTEKNNNAAGVRLRKATKRIKELASQIKAQSLAVNAKEEK